MLTISAPGDADGQEAAPQPSGLGAAPGGAPSVRAARRAQPLQFKTLSKSVSAPYVSTAAAGCNVGSPPKPRLRSGVLWKRTEAQPAAVTGLSGRRGGDPDGTRGGRRQPSRRAVARGDSVRADTGFWIGRPWRWGRGGSFCRPAPPGPCFLETGALSRPQGARPRVRLEFNEQLWDTGKGVLCPEILIQSVSN